MCPASRPELPYGKPEPPSLPCTVYRLRMAARRATRLYDKHLAPAGLGIAQFGLLQMLCARGGETVTSLAQALDLERTTLTRNLTPLIRQGFVDLKSGPDRRSRAVNITPAGRIKAQAAVALWRNAQMAVRDALGTDAVEKLHDLLDDTVEKLPDGA